MASCKGRDSGELLREKKIGVQLLGSHSGLCRLESLWKSLSVETTMEITVDIIG